MGNENKIPLNKAMDVARRFLKLIETHVKKVEIAGSIRRQCKEVDHIELVCVEDVKNPLSNVFHDNYPGMEVNGARLKRFKYPKDKIQIELYIAPHYDYGRILAIRTGSSAFHHIKLSVTYNRLGWCATEHGLRRKKECIKKGIKWYVLDEFKSKPTMPPVFNTEYDFFEFLGIPYILPQDRNWIAKNNKLNYSH